MTPTPHAHTIAGAIASALALAGATGLIAPAASPRAARAQAISAHTAPAAAAPTATASATTGSEATPPVQTGVTTTAFADYRDIAAAAGLTARTIIGGERTKDYILETTGGGAAIVDYDADGWPDLFLVNGLPLPAAEDGIVRIRLESDGTTQGGTKTDAPFSHLYRNNGDGTFTDVTEKAGLVRRGWGQGVCAGDYDNDGHVDLFVTYYGGVALYRNNGNGTFSDATSRSGLVGANSSGASSAGAHGGSAGSGSPGNSSSSSNNNTATPFTQRWNTGAAFLDHDRDGVLDLFVSAYVAFDEATKFRPGSSRNCLWKGLPVMCGPQGLTGSRNVLYRGNGDGTFTDVSAKSGVSATRPAFGFTPLVVDIDNDRWPDVYVANDSNASWLFRNNADGTFTEVGLQAGVALTADGRAQAGMGAGAGDFDRDGLLDLVKTNFDDDTTSLYRNLGHARFDDVTHTSGLGVNTRFLGWGTGFIDIDLDGWLDLFTVNGHVYPEADEIGGAYRYAQRKIVYRNLRNGRFEDVSTRAGAGILVDSAARGAATGDLFNTGRPDIVINNMHAAPALLHDCAPTAHHALVLQLIGTKSNRSAIGARVTLHVGERRLIDEVRSGGSFCSQPDLRIHAGLGTAQRVDRVEIAWPGRDNATETTGPIDADQRVVIREGRGIVRKEPFVRHAALCRTR